MMVILISEDDKDIRTVMELMLKTEHKDVTVYTVENGLEALKILEAGNINFDVLITDYNMPKMNGDELVKEVFKQNIQLKKIIMLSGRFENSDDMETLAQEHSNISFLFKPITPENLLKAVF